MPNLPPPRHIPTLPTAADFHAIRDGPQSTHSSPLPGSSVNTYPSGGRISFGWSMVKISYQAVAQMRPLSPAERRDLRRVLESDELQNQPVQSRISKQVCCEVWNEQESVGEGTKTAT